MDSEMMKECVILNGQIINIGLWDYQIQPFELEPPEYNDEGERIKEGVYENRPTNPLPTGATVVQRDVDYTPDRGWFEVGTTPPQSEAEQIASLKARLATAEQSAADNSLITQQLLETLIDLEVI